MSPALLLRTPPVNPDFDSRDFYRHAADNRNPIDLCLITDDDRVFCTNIEELSASSFSCQIKGLAQILIKNSMTALFVLPLKEPSII